MRKPPIIWRPIALAVAALAQWPQTAEAVSVNPSGLGQVLLYPYYSARVVGGAANTTPFSLTNTDGAKGKALRVTFREGKAGANILDFNVFLAPGQTWAATVVPHPSGGAGIFTASKACTIPPFPPAPTVIGFVNFIYAADGMGGGLDRTLEGHIEVIEMATYAPGSQTFAAINPVGGVASCATSDTVAAAEAQAPTGKVMGYAEVVNVVGGTSYAAAPTALEAFSTNAQYYVPGSTHPNLADVNPATAMLTAGGTVIWASGFPRAVDAVSAVLMRNDATSIFGGATPGSATDRVLTFPTKSYYYSGGAPVALFQRVNAPGGACDDIGFPVYAPPPVPSNGALCSAANVITFNNGSVLGSANAFNLTTPSARGLSDVQYSSGVAFHRLDSFSGLTYNTLGGTTGGSVTFAGLPTIGMTARHAAAIQTIPLVVSKAGTGLGKVTGAGIDCGSDCSEFYISATTVDLLATPAAGSVFTGWSGACAGTGICTVAMSVARNVSATFTSSNAGSAYASEYLQKSYVAYYGRPADPAGLGYWATRMDNEGGSLSSIIGSFGTSDEFNRRYGGLSFVALVTLIYQQTLGRGPDPAGLAYYVGELQAGRRTIQSITLDVLNGATTPPDSFVVANKLDVANHYTGKVALGCPYGTELTGVSSLTSVTAELTTVSAAKFAIEGRCGP